MAVIGLDFDNTLFGETEDGELELIEGAREAVVELKRMGHTIVIHTCRTTVAREQGTLADEIRWIEETLDLHGIPFDEIFAGSKLIADAYIDDRSVPFRGDWPETLEALDQHLGNFGRRSLRKSG